STSWPGTSPGTASCSRSCAAGPWPCRARSPRCTWFRTESKRRVVRFAGADADDPVDFGDEDLAVANLAGLGGLQDGFDDLIDQFAANCDLDSGLGHEVDDILGTTVQLGMAALATKAFHFRDRHAGNSDLRQRGTNVVKFERLDNCSNQFHARLPPPLFSMAFRAVQGLDVRLHLSCHDHPSAKPGASQPSGRPHCMTLHQYKIGRVSCRERVEISVGDD